MMEEMVEMKPKGFTAVSVEEDGNGSAHEARLAQKNFHLKVIGGICAFVAIVFVIAFAISASKNSEGVRPITAAGPCVTADCVVVASQVLAMMNQSVAPCEDFYEYACGGWHSANPVPDDKASYGSFTVIGETNQKLERKLLSGNISTPTGAKASYLFQACLDEEAIDARGSEPIQALFWDLNDTFFDVAGHWQPGVDHTSLGEVLARLHLQGNGGLFSSGVGPDDKNSIKNAMFLSQGGLSLPSADYYRQDRDKDPVLKAFLSYLSTAFELVGIPTENATRIANHVLTFEQHLANFTLPPDELRDPEKLYNPRSLSELAEDCPNIDWVKYFAIIYQGQGTVTNTVVATPSFFKNLTDLLEYTPKSILVEYFQAHLLMDNDSLLSQAFRDNKFKFRKALFGVQQVPERWKTCVAVANSLGFAVGEAFVQAQFSKEARTAAEEMLTGVTNAFAESFDSLPWADATTVAGAKLKASKISKKIGYPKWFDNTSGVEDYYKGLGSLTGFFEGVNAVSAWQTRKDYMSLFKPVDHTKWEMFPQEVNAYYHPSLNEIVFPAGILQPPFFSVKSLKALNFGGIGAVMGHEISHAFDDQGAQYDGDGNLARWWSDQSYQAFEKQTSCFANQYGNFSVPGPSGPVPVNGNLTLGENIADNGGVRAAYKAYQTWVGQHARESKLPGLDASPEQLFFLGYAQVWCSNVRPSYAKAMVLTDPHSPARFRVNAVAMNSKEFSSAFQCPVGSKMNPREKCSVW